eukprot:TRINITY_DN1623_c0_g1_i2.p1 TRINITY_DN1623_c0_g1~~TRINITY_DN1623_c0_g1_i2.p1  ORF type:complete len:264 (+),score=45.85 TRINITY_DN1623_c0_g1_i2:76-792(+)
MDGDWQSGWSNSTDTPEKWLGAVDVSAIQADKTIDTDIDTIFRRALASVQVSEDYKFPSDRTQHLVSECMNAFRATLEKSFTVLEERLTRLEAHSATVAASFAPLEERERVALLDEIQVRQQRFVGNISSFDDEKLQERPDTVVGLCSSSAGLLQERLSKVDRHLGSSTAALQEKLNSVVEASSCSCGELRERLMKVEGDVSSCHAALQERLIKVEGDVSSCHAALQERLTSEGGGRC